ncbi:MAG: adenine nucleotide alpha hydrolase [Bacteroidetes bacterium]|nr:adenine nucleotide alpha hydrolase [Bacteroidota bacterium]
MKVVLFWSGGKDSAMALYLLKQNPNVEIIALLSTLNSDSNRISMHEISEKLLNRQTKQLGFPHLKMWVKGQTDHNSYAEAFLEICSQLKHMGADTLVFGDIFLQDIRSYREKLAESAGFGTYFPLWDLTIEKLVKIFYEGSFQAIICCVQENKLGTDWLGKKLNKEFFSLIPEGIDAFGENGEYHTFCFEGSIFKKPISFEIAEVIPNSLILKPSEDLEEIRFIHLDLL